MREKRGRSIYSGRRGEDRRGRTKMAAVGERIRGRVGKMIQIEKGEEKLAPVAPACKQWLQHCYVDPPQSLNCNSPLKC